MNKPTECLVEFTIDNCTGMIISFVNLADAGSFKQGDTVTVTSDQPRVPVTLEEPEGTLYRDAVRIQIDMSEGPFSVDKVFSEGPALIDGDADFVCRLPIVINSTHDAAIRNGTAQCTGIERDLLIKKVDANTAILMNANISFRLLSMVAFQMPPEDPETCLRYINTVRQHLAKIVKDWHYV